MTRVKNRLENNAKIVAARPVTYKIPLANVMRSRKKYKFAQNATSVEYVGGTIICARISEIPNYPDPGKRQPHLINPKAREERMMLHDTRKDNNDMIKAE